MNQWIAKRDRHRCTASRGPLVKGIQSVGCMAVLAIVSACGGGGGGSSTSKGSSSADSLAQICAEGNSLVVDATRKTTVGTFSDEQKWVNAYLNERYLWYKDIPTNVQASAAEYNVYTPDGKYFLYGESLVNYYRDLLNPKTTSSGKKVDEFSFLTTTAIWNENVNSIELGYGFNVTGTVGSSSGVVISYVYPGSSGDTAGFNRLLKYPTQKCGTLHGTFDFHATLSHSELPALFEADFIGLSLVFPHFPRLTLFAHGFAPACAYA